MNGAEARVIVDHEGDQQVPSCPNGEELSCKSIVSVDDLAELFLTTTATKRLLIAFGHLTGSEPTEDATVLAERLLAQHGTERAVRKILDAAPQAEVVRILSKVVWEGHEGAYVLKQQGEDVGSLRAAVLCLTTLVTAHLERGARGVDSVASTTPLLRLIRREQPVKAKSAGPAADRHTQALIELLSTSAADDVFLVLADDLLAMPARAAKAVLAQWQGWIEVVKDSEFNVEQSVAATPCLPPGARDVVVAHIRESTPVRLLGPSDAPDLANLACCISRIPVSSARQTIQRAYGLFFTSAYQSVDDLLLACLGLLLRPSETS